ncbi:MAG: ribonuclease III [Oscillospiraceae bacterium]|nr:ribonuclease III [Oscillospiraceae bacterium]
MVKLKKFEEKLGYKFKDNKLLRIALTHSSFTNEFGTNSKNYERLEFLGDSVLSLIVSEYIFFKFPKMLEGELTRLRSSLVCEKTLKIFATDIDIGNFLFLSRGEERSGGRQRSSILADVFEAVIAAIFIDGGLEPVKKIVLKFIEQQLENLNNSARDYKTEIQELVQAKGEHVINYVVLSESGPDHDKEFTIELKIDGNTVGIGKAKSKKEAEKSAAKEALKLY